MGAIAIEEQRHHKGWPNEAGFNAAIIHGDTTSPISLKISGYFPDYVCGSLFRTGPGAYKVPRAGTKDGYFSLSHWFDGFATLHRFDLMAAKNGRCEEIRYSSRLQVDELVEKARTTGKLEGIFFGQKRDPCESLYGKTKSFFEPINPSTPGLSNIGVTLRDTLPSEISPVDRKAGKKRPLMSLTTDSGYSQQFDAETLEPVAVADQSTISSELSGQFSAAHASHDPKTGEIFNYNLKLGPVHTYRIWQASPSGQSKVLATIRGSDVRGAYIHSLLLTDNFVILCVWPAYFRTKGISILWERNLLDAMKFEPNAQATWYVVDRHHGRGVVKKFTSPPFFCFHTTNAWEEKSAIDDSTDIICELVELPNIDILQHLYYDSVISTGPNTVDREQYLKNTHVRLVRYKLDNVPLQTASGVARSRPATGSTTKIMEIESGDLPQFNLKYSLKPHRYVYTTLDRSKSSFMDGLGKTDTKEGTTVVWEHDHHTPGEPVFVPAPNAVDEDDGVILCVVLDGDLSKSYLLCLDARTFTEIGRAELPVAVGFGLHGAHLPLVSSAQH